MLATSTSNSSVFTGVYGCNGPSKGVILRPNLEPDLEGDSVVLLTASRVLFFRTSRIHLLWDLPFSTVQGVTIEDTGIRFESNSGKEYDRFVSIGDPSTRDEFFKSVASVVKQYNAQRRIEK